MDIVSIGISPREGSEVTKRGSSPLFIFSFALLLSRHDGLRHRICLDVSFHIEEIILYKEVSHECSIMKLIDSKDRIDIVPILYLEKAKWNESIFDEWDIGSDA